MKKIIKVMKALSDPNRVRIIKLLQKGPQSVSDITYEIGISQSAISTHLKVLDDAGLVNFQREGRWVFYGVSDGSSSPYAASMLGNLKRWLVDNKR